MLNLSFLVSLPACFGTYMIIHPSRSRVREAQRCGAIYCNDTWFFREFDDE